MNLTKEAELWFTYLTGDIPNQEVCDQYQRAIENLGFNLNPKEHKILRACFKFPFLCSGIDTYLGFSFPQSNIRNRILLMFSLLECHPTYMEHFINKKSLTFSGLKTLWILFKSVFLLFLGYIILTVLGCRKLTT